jgi:hypothetical protein
MTALQQAIETHRELYRAELHFSPSQRTPPVAYRFDEKERALVPDDRPLVINPLTADEIEVPDSATQSTQVGMPMSSRMLRYLQGPTADTPWSFSLARMRGWCRKNHRYHMTPPHWRGSLCWQFVYYVVVREFSIVSAATVLQYDHPEPVLRDALQHIEDRMDDLLADQERRAKEDEGQAMTCVCGHSWSRHDDPAGMFRCTTCECRRYNADAKAA